MRYIVFAAVTLLATVAMIWYMRWDGDRNLRITRHNNWAPLDQWRPHEAYGVAFALTAYGIGILLLWCWADGLFVLFGAHHDNS